MNNYNGYDDYNYQDAMINTSSKNFQNLLFPLFFLFIIGIFFSISIWILTSELQDQKTFENEPFITSTISNIESYRNPDGDLSYTAYVTYEVDGTTYTTRLSYYSSSMSLGDEVLIQYSSTDPSVIYYGSGATFKYILFGVLLVIFSVIFIIFVRCIYNNIYLKSLINTGEKIKLTVIDYEENHSVRINHRRPFNLICIDSNTNKKYLSNQYFLNPFNKYPINSSIYLYISQEDPYCFYIDTSLKGIDE